MAIIYNGTAAADRLTAKSVFPYRDVIQMQGHGGHDELSGGFLNPNRIFGGAGDDTLHGGADTNLLDGGDGNDILNAWQGDHSILRGGAGNDRITAGWGGAVLDGGTGADSMTGGDGGDIYVVDHRRDVIVEHYRPRYHNDPNPVDQVKTTVDWILGANLEHLVLMGSASINGTGNALSNAIIGNGGNNILKGGGGADTLDGGLGNDILDGGEGVDTARFTTNTAISVNLGTVLAQNTGAGTDIIRHVENVVTSAGNDRILGNAFANVLVAGSGNDVLSAMAGNDRLSGQAGNDRLQGGAGNDVLTGGDGADQFLFSKGGGTDRIMDFTDRIDRIVIDSGAETFAQVRIADLGADARITFGDVTVILSNVDHALLGVADFIFV
ncbi:calcium-binding protein [Paracoccus sp. SY]|uniref:calcium-binding protein n=1 Tax=Paracoccus sp. SY TaxID=1330255 RepID=UPI0011AF4DD2|nr:calcium-binding protein [Paracoccus sp. SY]